MIFWLLFALVFAVFLYVLYKWRKEEYGPLAKVAYLLGIRLESLEKKRWIFFQHNPTRRSENLIVSFAGGALRIAGIPHTEFRKSLQNFDCDQLYVMDITGMTWYLQDPNFKWNGYEYYETKLREYCQNYKKCFFIGNCMGASGALMMSHLANKVVVFNPQVDPSSEKNYAVKVGRRLLPKSLKNQPLEYIKKNTSLSKASIHVHEVKHRDWVQQSSFLPSNVHVTVYNNCYNAATYLKEQGKLIPLLKEQYDDMNSN